MSGCCWCKCEAGLGQCGPKVPRLKSLFGGSQKHTDEEASMLRRGDRQAELQVIWDEIGEQKSHKVEELRQQIAAAVDKVYDRALEEGVRRKTALEENVKNSEERLAERILGAGSGAKKVMGDDVDMDFMLSWLSAQELFEVRARAPSQLSLQTRLDMNMARLHELDVERMGGYGWVGGLVVMVELRHRVMLLRETLNLPPCDPLADLDKLLVSTMEDLNVLYPGKSATMSLCDLSGREQKKPVIHRLQRFYQALRAIESTWVETFAHKDSHGASSDGQGLVDQVERAAQIRLQNIQEKRNVKKQKTDRPVSRGTSNYSGSGSKLQSSKNKITRRLNAPSSSEESHSFEVLSQHIISKLDTLNQQLKLTVRTTQESPSLCSPSSETDTPKLWDKSAPELLPARDSSPLSISGKTVRTPTSVRTRAANPPTCCLSGMLLEGEVHHLPEPLVEVAGLPRADLLPCTARETTEFVGARTSSLSIAKASASLRLLPNCSGKALKTPGQQPPPPPPPPMPRSLSGHLPFREQSSKLKRSVKVSRLYRNLKRKIEGAPRMGVGSSSPRLSISGTREGMAEALAEITKKSTYFQKIEGDVRQFHDSIEESKLALEVFETADMEQLLRFHKALESILENLTDETQVLARFKGFPSKKLETVRLAAALYSRLQSMAQGLEKWEVQASASEHLGKVIRYFEKIKKDLEIVEGSKENDLKRFTSQKINFDFSILERIKEGMVGLSSRCLVQALEESKKSKEGNVQSSNPKCQKFCSQMLWRAFQLAYQVYNFAGGHDDQSERLISEVASELDSFPPEIWT